MSLKGEEMQKLYKEQEKWFKKRRGGFFFSLPEGSAWKRAPKLMQEQSEKSITKVLNTRVTNTAHLDINRSMGSIASLYIDEEEGSTMFQFHALRFPDGRQWDAVNGFRK